MLDGIASFCFHKAKEIEENEQTSSLLVDDNELLNLKSVEGTVLLHAIFAVKQDQDLGKEFIKYIKVNVLVCSSSFCHIQSKNYGFIYAEIV